MGGRRDEIQSFPMELDPISMRLLGCLVEKEMTTPEYYPMTVNALTAAANQKTNRDPVVAYSEADTMRGLDALRELGLVRAVSSPGSRAVKFKHALTDILEIDGEQASLLAVLMLRGEQTSGELRLRTERYHHFAQPASVEEVLHGLESRQQPLAKRLERRPGEKESRYRHLLGGDPIVEPASDPPPSAPLAPTGELEQLRARVAELEARVARLEDAGERAADSPT
jgi:uncharacterized protein YceH (UPF0502 family)